MQFALALRGLFSTKPQAIKLTDLKIVFVFQAANAH